MSNKMNLTLDSDPNANGTPIKHRPNNSISVLSGEKHFDKDLTNPKYTYDRSASQMKEKAKMIGQNMMGTPLPIHGPKNTGLGYGMSPLKYVQHD